MKLFPPAAVPSPGTVKTAWNKFVSGGAVEPGTVRPHVLRAWERCMELGCDPWLARADVLPGPETAHLLQREERLVQVATPFLDALSLAAGRDRHAAMLSDGHGRVLKVIGDRLTMEDENFPRAGSLLSEATAGANGIGTTVAEGRYVELIGPEHFIEGFQVFTCQGVPLVESPGACSGVISMSVRRVEAAFRIRDILFCASEAAECELLSSRLCDAVAQGQVQGILEPLRQDIVQGIAIARLQLELAAHDLALSETAAVSLREAQELIEGFRQQAALWRDLAERPTGEQEAVRLAELAENFCRLMATQARVTNTKLVFGRMENLRVVEDRRALSQRLLEAFLTTMQGVQPGSEIQVEVVRRDGSGRIALRGIAPEGGAVVHAVEAMLVS